MPQSSLSVPGKIAILRIAESASVGFCNGSPLPRLIVPVSWLVVSDDSGSVAQNRAELLDCNGFPLGRHH